MIAEDVGKLVAGYLAAGDGDGDQTQKLVCNDEIQAVFVQKCDGYYDGCAFVAIAEALGSRKAVM